MLTEAWPAASASQLGGGPPRAGSAHLRAAFEAVPWGLMTFDGRLDVLAANAQLVTLLGLPNGSGAGESLRDLLGRSPVLDEPAAACVREACRVSLAGGARQEATVLTAAPAPRIRVQAFALPDGTGLASFEALPTRAAPPASAGEETMLDPLTALPNRQLYQNRLVSALGTGSELVVMMLDLDRFKIVNDTLGHPRGGQPAAVSGQTTALGPAARRRRRAPGWGRVRVARRPSAGAGGPGCLGAADRRHGGTAVSGRRLPGERGRQHRDRDRAA